MSAVVVSLDEYRFRRASAVYDEATRQLAIKEASRARREGRIPVTSADVKRMMETLCCSLGELEILRERLVIQEQQEGKRVKPNELADTVGKIPGRLRERLAPKNEGNEQ